MIEKVGGVFKIASVGILVVGAVSMLPLLTPIANGVGHIFHAGKTVKEYETRLLDVERKVHGIEGLIKDQRSVWCLDRLTETKNHSVIETCSRWLRE